MQTHSIKIHPIFHTQKGPICSHKAMENHEEVQFPAGTRPLITYAFRLTLFATTVTGNLGNFIPRLL